MNRWEFGKELACLSRDRKPMLRAKGATIMLTAIALAVLGCSSVPAPTAKAATPEPTPIPAESVGTPMIKVSPPKVKTDPAEARRVLLVINDSSSASKEIGEYYRVKRMIPAENVLRLKVPDQLTLNDGQYKSLVEEPVRKKIADSKHPIDFIVLTKGMPIVANAGPNYSLDSRLGAMNLAFAPIQNPTAEEIRRSVNPYFRKAEPFSSQKYGFYLVTRLDGYTVADAKRLVDNSLAAKPLKGPFLFDADPTRTSNGYKIMADSLARAIEVMKGKGMEVIEDRTNTFVSPGRPVAGYATWGSNDRRFSASVYKSIKFHPGALAETFVSTSARAFTPQTDGQSMIADLIASGVTGVKGYVTEPYTFALAHPDIIFDRYTAGFNLAESFYMGSLVLKWKDLVVGDPLCRPYAKK